MEEAGLHLAHGARGVVKEFLSEGWPQVLRGLAVSVIALKRSISNPAIVGPYWAFLKAFTARVLGLYGVVGLLGLTILAPVVALLAVRLGERSHGEDARCKLAHASLRFLRVN